MGTPDQDAERGASPKQRALPVHGMQERGEMGGANLEKECTPFVRGLIQERGGIPQDLWRPHTARQNGAEGSGEEGRESTGFRDPH